MVEDINSLQSFDDEGSLEEDIDSIGLDDD
jgi:hypothetical protein